MARASAFVTASPDEESRVGTPQEQRKDAWLQFIQAVVFVSIAVWISPPFGSLGIGVIMAAVIYSIPFVVRGLKLLQLANKPANVSKQKNTPNGTAKGTQQANSARNAAKSATRENSASQTAKSSTKEDAIALILQELQQQGWNIEYNLPIPQAGTVDVFLRSPKKNYFIIDVKHEPGEVFFDEGVLKRRQWSQIYNFQEDYLQTITEKALAVKKKKRLRLVTPVLCFTEATVSIETVNNKARDVYVEKKKSLVRKLLRLDD